MYQTNLNTLLSSLSSNIDRNGFYNSSEGQGSDMVNGIALCRGDVELDICRRCVNDSTRGLSQLCPNNKQAIGWYDYCMLRYSNQSFLGTMDTRPAFYMWNTNNISDVVQFNQDLRNLLDGLRGRAGSGGSLRKFATGNTSFTTATDFGTIYGLVQCTPDLSEQLCSDCLIGAMQEIGSCCFGRRGGRVIYPSCNLRYELDDPFYNETTPEPPLSPPPASSGSNNTANTSYQSNLSDLLGSLTSAAATNTFYKNTSNGIYGLYLCRGDVPIDVCQNCVNTANQDIQNQCPSNQQAIIWYDECMLYYSNTNFFGMEQTYPWFFMWNLQNNTSSTGTDVDTLALMYALAAKAPHTEMMYGTDESAATNGSKGRPWVGAV
ncbi:hypothetical protein F0562_014231 [Nyssa sinensis]|uniref:Gnk2-homologous domain-containing protein n=1 Tax=Nyssa sinensis TaxID=561372 RepID=A0A5J4ZSC8_9ASTE|nr:hypothetical protein F0562_014231 [Nyssa sinensis]